MQLPSERKKTILLGQKAGKYLSRFGPGAGIWSLGRLEENIQKLSVIQCSASAEMVYLAR